MPPSAPSPTTSDDGVLTVSDVGPDCEQFVAAARDVQHSGVGREAVDLVYG